MTTSQKLSYLVQIDADQKMSDGIKKHLVGITSLPFGNQVVTPAQLAQVFDDRVAAAQAAQAATAARVTTIKAHRDKQAETASMARGAVRLVQGLFAESPDTLDTFGLSPRKVAKRTAEGKAAAVVQSQATRAARHTMGPKQKAAIKGTVGAKSPPATASPSASTSVGGSTSVPATAAAPAPTAASPATPAVHPAAASPAVTP